MVRAGTMSARTGIFGVGTTTTTTSMEDTSGCGVATDALECTSTVCAPCIGITRATGAECGLIGTCGVATNITAGRAGSGVDTVESQDIFTACGFCGVGMVPAGTTSELTGISTAEIITITNCMAEPGGLGVVSDALVFICIACEPCTATTRVTGVA